MDKGKYHNVYFILTHLNTLKIQLSLSEAYSDAKTLELIDQPKNVIEEPNYTIKIYRFKICPITILEKYKKPEDLEIELIIEDENKNRCMTKIKNFDLEHDNYLYDFEIDSELDKDNQLTIFELKLSH